ncbi:MAG: response regulator [Acidimicrobiales bacterium]|nr:response regulator [Acidimicrobiales bacterium]
MRPESAHLFSTSLLDGSAISHVVVLEDNDQDAERIGRLLRRVWPVGLTIDRHDCLAAFLDDSQVSRADVILTDLGLPDGKGIEVIEQVQAHAGTAPIVVLTGESDPSVAERSLLAGVEDYLVKDGLNTDGLERSIRHSVVRSRNKHQLLQATQALHRSNTELDNYAAIVAHDLRAPARTARLLADRIRANLQSPEMVTDLIDRLDDCLGHLEQLISGLLEFASVNDATIGEAHFDLAAMVDEIRDDLAADLEKSGGRLECDSSLDIAGEPLLMKQVLSNIIENSIKYRRPDVAPIVTVSAERHGRNMRLTIEDNGMGIEPEYHERVFGLFERLHTDQQVEGLGLGLSWCQKVVELHGGSIQVAAPDADHGTTITISLPHRLGAPALAGAGS